MVKILPSVKNFQILRYLTTKYIFKILESVKVIKAPAGLEPMTYRFAAL